MKLAKEDVELFYKLYNALIIYVNGTFNIVHGLDSVGDLAQLPLQQIDRIRDRLYGQPELIDSFTEANPSRFSSNELDTISSWKHFVKGQFFIIRYLKNHAIFLHTSEQPRAYGVSALISPFEDVVGPHLPVMVDAVLLPFNGKIVYDGILTRHPIIFGGGIRRSLNDDYQEAKAKYGVITSLPFSPGERKQEDADRLRFYLRSQRNRERYWEEIGELMDKDSALMTLYHQEMGKIHARRYGKRLSEIGLTNAWFAILEGMIVASGPKRGEVERVLETILPREKRKFVYIFQLKGK